MEYELCFWLQDPGTDAQPVEDLEKIRQAVEGSGASIIIERPLEKKFLAYPIKKQKSAFWGEIAFNCEPSSILKIQKALQYENNILRKMIVELKKPKKVKPSRQPERRKEAESVKDVGREPAKANVSDETLDTKLKEILDYEP